MIMVFIGMFFWDLLVNLKKYFIFINIVMIIIVVVVVVIYNLVIGVFVGVLLVVLFFVNKIGCFMVVKNEKFEEG